MEMTNEMIDIALQMTDTSELCSFIDEDVFVDIYEHATIENTKAVIENAEKEIVSLNADIHSMQERIGELDSIIDEANMLLQRLEETRNEDIIGISDAEAELMSHPYNG